MKDNLTVIALIACLFMASVPHASHAFFLFPLGGGGTPPPPVREYDNKKRLMIINPFWSMDTDEYTEDNTKEPDYRLRDTEFKGAAEQDLFAGDDLRGQSTLGYQVTNPDGSDTIYLNNIQGSQPRAPMPMKVTERFSPLELSPWYLISILDPDGSGQYYQGPAYRGDRNPIHARMRMVRPSPTMQMGCSVDPMVAPTGGAPDPLNASWMRKELDNCLNQYILQQARYIRDPEDADGEYFGVHTGMCQPFRLEIPPTEHDLYEYVPSEYIGVAWIKLLMDSSWQYRRFSRAEPNYQRDTGVRVTAQIPLPADNLGLILVEDLAEFPGQSGPAGGGGEVDLHFEKILDPSHPYSPRWDFERSDRTFSFLTAGYDGDTSEGIRCSDEVTVDLLTFRKHLFERWIPQKTGYNTYCYNDRPWHGFGCYNIIWNLLLRCSPDEACCSTRWNIADKWEKLPGGSLLARAICGVPMYEICNYVARPVTPINTLKMREINEDNFGDQIPGTSPENTVPEGYGFAEYFGDHKPYMRCWDTNTECGETSQKFEQEVKHHGDHEFVYNPDSDLGSKFALMGAGRENESCLIGGSRENIADPIASWSELKLYYVRSQRMGPKCLAIHSKLFKAYTGEEMLLSFTGAQWQQKFRTITTGKLARYKSRRWNYGWRGYISDSDPERRFPNLGLNGGSAPMRAGLDNAVKGEILVYDATVVGNANGRRNPYVAYVKDAVNQRFRNQIQDPAIRASLDPAKDFVQVVTFNHGKYIDACGNSDELGMGADFTMYKQALPSSYVELLNSLGQHTKECSDPRLSACIEPLWGSVKRYYISEDYRG